MTQSQRYFLVSCDVSRGRVTEVEAVLAEYAENLPADSGEVWPGVWMIAAWDDRTATAVDEALVKVMGARRCIMVSESVAAPIIRLGEHPLAYR